MKSVYKKLIFGIILLQIILTFYISLNNQIYSWDEASYILNAKSVAGKLDDSLQKYVVQERHPLLTWTLGFLYHSNSPEFTTKILIPLFYIGIIILAYYFGKKLFKEDVGIYAALFTSISAVLIGASVKILTDVPGAFLVFATLLCLYLGIDKPRFLLLSGLTGGLAILMRDYNIILLPVIAIYFASLNKRINKKYFYVSIAILLITLLPYFIDNYRLWGDPLYRIKMHTSMVVKGIGFNESPNLTKLIWLLALPFGINLSMFGIFIAYLVKHKEILKNRKHWFLIFWLIFAAMSIIFFLGLEMRYLVVLLIPLYIYASKYITELSKKWKAIAIISIFILNGFLVSDVITYDYIKLSNNDKGIFNFINDHTEKNTTIYTNLPPSLVAMYSGRTSNYEIAPNLNKEVMFYLMTRTKYININNTNYEILSNSSKFVLYKRKI